MKYLIIIILFIIVGCSIKKKEYYDNGNKMIEGYYPYGFGNYTEVFFLKMAKKLEN